MLIKSIMWDTNNDNEALASLPDEIETPNFLHQEDYKTMDDFFAAVAEWLIYEFGWCHFGFQAISKRLVPCRCKTGNDECCTGFC